MNKKNHPTFTDTSQRNTAKCLLLYTEILRLGVIKRSVDTTNVNVFSTLYLSLVRPILEYAVPVWCLYLVKDIHALESVQRRASRLTLNQHKREMPYVDPCKLLKWPSLSDRTTLLLKIVFFYKNSFKMEPFTKRHSRG